MSFLRTMRDDGVIESRIQGRVNLDDIQAHIHAIAAMAEGRKEFYEILVHEFGSFMDVEPDDLPLMEELSKTFLGHWNSGAIAFVAENDLSNAMCTQIAARVEPALSIRFQVFSDVEEAERWINLMKEYGHRTV